MRTSEGQTILSRPVTWGPRKLELVCSWCSARTLAAWPGEFMTITTPASQRSVFSGCQWWSLAGAPEIQSDCLQQLGALSASFQEHGFLCAGKAALLGRMNML